MHPLRLLGLILLGLAFLAAAFEVAARGLSQADMNLSAREVLSVFLPDALDSVRRVVVETISPSFWDYVVSPLLDLPGWLIFLLPGAVLFWRYRSDEDRVDAGAESFPDASYEDIVAAAREADEDDIGLPSKYRDLDEYDPSRRSPEGEFDDTPDVSSEPLWLTERAQNAAERDAEPRAANEDEPGRGDDPANRPS